jgi:tRNA(fMet)-specific endonuclease VapC
VILLDSDILTLFLTGHPRVTERMGAATDVVAITVVTRVEVLQGRFDSLLKAADGEQLRRAQGRLEQAERELAGEFDRLRQDKKLKKIGRADLLIACIALAHGATLVTRNLRHFRQVPGLKLENWAD